MSVRVMEIRPSEYVGYFCIATERQSLQNSMNGDNGRWNLTTGRILSSLNLADDWMEMVLVCSKTFPFFTAFASLRNRFLTESSIF